MKIKLTCQHCGRESLVRQVVDNQGHCPWDGIAFQPNYTAVLVEDLQRAEVAGTALEGALDRIAGARRPGEGPQARSGLMGRDMPDDNRYAVRVDRREGGWSVRILDPGGTQVSERACADEAEARTYASTVRQHVYWLSEERFRQYYRLQESA